jgi:predicted transcriptional regulator
MSDATIKIERELTSEIVSSFVRNNQLPSDQVAPLISTVHMALVGLGKPDLEPKIPAVPIRRSVSSNYVVCLECGWRGKMLKRHLSSAHALNPDEYRSGWKLPRNHPLTAPTYSERRSAVAKELGLGRRSKVKLRGVRRTSKPARAAKAPASRKPNSSSRQGRRAISKRR